MRMAATGNTLPLSELLVLLSLSVFSRTDFIVNASLQLAHGDPALLLLHLRVVVQYPVPQPGQVVNTQLVLLPCSQR